MNLNSKIGKTKGKVNVALDEDIKRYRQQYGIDEHVINPKLYEEPIEVIKLHYEKEAKWIVLHNASLIGFFGLTLVSWEKSHWSITSFCVLSLIISFVNTNISNKRVNIAFNTLLKKTKESATISESKQT